MLTSGLNGPEGTGLACDLNLAGFAPAGIQGGFNALNRPTDSRDAVVYPVAVAILSKQTKRRML